MMTGDSDGGKERFSPPRARWAVQSTQCYDGELTGLTVSVTFMFPVTDAVYSCVNI